MKTFLATGERWEKRGKRMDEQIEILKGLMNGDYFAFKGEFYDIPEIKLCPTPSKTSSNIDWWTF